MAYNRLSIQNKVLRRYDNSDFDTTTLQDFINDANREIINRHKWPFMEDSTTISVTQGTNSYSVGATVDTIFGLRVTAPTDEEIDITDYYLPIREFHERFPDPSADEENEPRFWTLEDDDTLLLSHEADGAYTLTMSFLAQPTELDEDTDVPDVPERFQEALVLGTLERVYEFDDRLAEATAIRSKKDELMEDMLMRITPRQIGRPHVMRRGRRVRGDFF